MSNFNDSLQQLVDLSHEDKLKLIVDNYKIIYPKLCEFDDEPNSDGHYTTMFILCGAVCMDGLLEPEESDIFIQIMGALGYNIPRDELPGLLKKLINSDINVYEIMARFMDTLNEDERVAFALMVGGICAIDDKIEKGEVKLIEKLLG